MGAGNTSASSTSACHLSEHSNVVGPFISLPLACQVKQLFRKAEINDVQSFRKKNFKN
jgi:hypothetical protein